MPPKNKGKKGKKQDDDDFWEKAGETVSSNTVASPPRQDEDEEETHAPAKASDNFAFAMLDEGGENEDEDFGGLMSTIKASQAKSKKDKKKKGRPGVSFEDGAGPEEGDEAEEVAAKGDISTAKKPVEMTAEELADEEWGAAKPKKGKKDKKGGKGRAAPVEEEFEEEIKPVTTVAAEPEVPMQVVEKTADEQADEEWGPPKPKKGKKDKKGPQGKSTLVAEGEETSPTENAEPPMSTPAKAVSVPAPTIGEDEEDEEPAGGRVLSKKEKEKLKKEREKAKKKVQAEAKKKALSAEEGVPSTNTVPVPPPPADAKDEEDEEDEDEAGGDKKKKDKKKKKKKTPAEVKEEVKEPPKRMNKALAALKAAQEAQRAAEEEAARKAEEERKRAEDEERRRQEEERLKEEEKRRKKEKEKAKREQLKKEGRLLTPKQKAEKAAAEARMRALVASGVQIAGLQEKTEDTKSRKVVYGKSKKKTPNGKAGPGDGHSASPSTPASVAPELPSVQSPQSIVTTELTPEITEIADDSVKDDWDASEPEELAKPEDDGVKEDWDAPSDEEPESKPVRITSPAIPIISARGAPINGKAPAEKNIDEIATPAKVRTVEKSAHAAKAPVQHPPAEEEEESEESEEEETDEDSDEDDSDEDLEESDEDGMTTTQRIAARRKEEAAQRRKERMEAALKARSKDNLRSPICCILGHVDTGKTKLLDKIRQTNVQEGEAGGITQQIGATYFPVEAIKQKTLVLNKDGNFDYKIPGLLIIDTPGHESFTNLRSRGSSLCNIAILVVDIMHGLEPQTLESLRLLRDRKTPFIVALNKIDRLYGWVATPDGAFRESLAKQKPAVQREFEDRVEKTILAFSEQGLNSILYYENKNFARNVSLVPTSAVTGEGVPDMIQLLVNLTQQRMSDSLMYLSELECTVLEVKVIEGLGTTIDVILSNGVLHEGDRIVVCGLNGPIVTNIRALLTPQPLRELRIKGQYVHHKEIKAAMGVKITAPGLENAIAGSRLLVVGPDDDEDDLTEEVMTDLTSLLSSIDKSGRGVCVQASTLGSLEALLDFLKVSRIPVSGINIGPVHKKDIMRAATMLERQRELACILAFDVPVDKDADKMAEELGVRIFKADIIYHLFDAFTAYNAEMTEARRRDAAPQAIWPCRLKIIQAFAKRDPIIVGVDILDGSLRVGTPLCVVHVDKDTGKRDIVDLGKVTSLEINHKSMDVVKKSQAGGGVAVKIEHAVYQSAKMFGRHFDDKDELLSHITRQSIDVLKETFREDVSKEEWRLVVALKSRLDIT
ncbi:hypothetical protein DACRYDRAFT_19346 [Dacryopinax primogenitus]|uniref:Eukaryotic translation initiation factor 5B n=1 Tax=Dacryopinax primogenitus (strain DJM 731) TaxID=1858805 RepID=M5GAT9_DACPD|nr:uncharacterized protein DACRYDRAFT_19346 [Dacryopinax primogenitus]EJU06004.1 hypothetical protein DACRYDRAFT_19346 [Dacryopinax primogenitus]